ncbi:MAG: choice-of-anchor B family protein [Bacteroidetes bacterium]|nr:choice-of-anchor B family protein [Bacteroidota bacterium]
MTRTITLILIILCTPATLSAQYALQFGGHLAVNDGQILVGEGRQLLLSGNVFVYEMTENGSWTERQVLTPGGDVATGFGRSLSTEHNTLAVGAPLANEVYIYSRSDEGTWMLSETLKHPNVGFGTAVSLREDHLLIGAPGAPDSEGVAYLFSRDEQGTWSMTHEIAHDNTSAADRYGTAVEIHGTDFVVSAPQWDGRKGRVLVYAHQESPSLDAQEILLNEAGNGDLFGSSVASLGDFLAVGAPGRDDGAVFLFSKDENGTWQENHVIIPPDTSDGGRFGEKIVGQDNKLWISDTHFNERNGGLYYLDLSTMQLSNVLSPDVLQFRSEFGASLAVDENLVAVGAVGHDNYEGVVFPLHVTDEDMEIGEALFNLASEIPSITGDITECESGTAGIFPCAEVDMISFLTREEIGAQRGIQVNDVWGWEDPQTGREYALVGRTDGTSFIDLTDPYRPVYLGDLPKTSTANQSLWRDIKVYNDHAFIVADGAGAHHMQIFDLTQLRDVTEPRTFTETALYKGVYSSHNIVINKETGFAYAVGSDSGGETCGGALHMINIQDPVNPTFAGCFADVRTGRRGTGSTHDAQCVIYNGPDLDYQGREICLSSNETALSIADVTNKENPIALSIAHYPNVAYTHQGWLTEDHKYFYLNDEGDEMSETVQATRTLIFDLGDLEDPVLVKEYFGPSSAIDHNLYIQGDIMYQTNYVEGLRIVDVSDPENPLEVGHFDTVPYGPNDNSPVLGAWSSYPFFKSGTIVVTSGREGVFFLKKRPLDL